MDSYNKKMEFIKKLNKPFEYFKGQKVKLVLMDDREFKGILLNHNVYDIELVTNIGTKDNHEKGILVIHKNEIKYIIENNKGTRNKKKK